MPGRVEILTDEYGVNHLYGPDRRALAFGQGYVQARDRLFQLDVLRHVGRGESAGVLGPGQLPSDVQVRRDLFSDPALSGLLEEAPARLQTAFEGFADGVNRAMTDMAREHDVPAEFPAVAHLPEPWRPTDSVAIAVYMLGYFGVFGGDELPNAIRFTRLADRLGERTAWAAYRDLNRLRVPGAHPASLDRPVEGGERALGYEAVPSEQLRLLRAAAGATPWGVDAADAPELTGLREARGVTAGFGFGSNALAVAGSRTETGAPMLFGGPQMGYYRPPAIYEVGLHGGPIDAVGVGVVGTPSIVIGRTPEFAWTITSGYDDMTDTVAVELHPSDRHRYEWGDEGGYRTMRVETVTHRPSVLGAAVAGERPRGPIEQERAFIAADGHLMPVVAWNPEERVAWAQRTTVRGDELAGMDAMTAVPEAGSLEAAAGAVAELPFSFNYLLADDETVRYVHAGRVPEREPGFDWRFPVPGGDGRWRGTTHTVRDHGMDVTDPDRGWVFQWNNAPATGWRAGDREQHWGRAHRVDALTAAAEAALEGGIDFETLAALIERAGRHDPVARHTAPFMIEAGRAAEDPRVIEATETLADWAEAGYPWAAPAGRHHAGMRIWEATRLVLQSRLFDGTLGALAPTLEYDPPRSVTPGEDRTVHAGDHGVTHKGDVLLARVFDGDAEYDWLGGDPEGAVRTALRRAAEGLTREFGTADPTAWRLPERTVKFDPMGALPGLEVPLVHRGTFNHVVAPADDRAVDVLPPSNTGHLPLGGLLGAIRGQVPSDLEDQLDAYRAFEYTPMPLTREAVEANAYRTRRLRAEAPTGRLPRVRAWLGWGSRG